MQEKLQSENIWFSFQTFVCVSLFCVVGWLTWGDYVGVEHLRHTRTQLHFSHKGMKRSGPSFFEYFNIIYKFHIRHQLLYFLRFICLTLYSCLTFALSISHINSTYIHELLVDFHISCSNILNSWPTFLFSISHFLQSVCLSGWNIALSIIAVGRFFAVFSFPSFQTIIIIFKH